MKDHSAGPTRRERKINHLREKIDALRTRIRGAHDPAEKFLAERELLDLNVEMEHLVQGGA